MLNELIGPSVRRGEEERGGDFRVEFHGKILRDSSRHGRTLQCTREGRGRTHGGKERIAILRIVRHAWSVTSHVRISKSGRLDQVIGLGHCLEMPAIWTYRVDSTSKDSFDAKVDHYTAGSDAECTPSCHDSISCVRRDLERFCPWTKSGRFLHPLLCSTPSCN